MEHDRDTGLDRLARELRERGTPPARDLWPEIDAAIDREEARRLRRPRTVGWRALAAAAALLILVVGARDLLRTPAPGGESAPPRVAAAEPEPAGGMATVQRALAELGDALAADPDNPNLSRLVLMVHRTRGELLRRHPDPGLRATDI